MSLELEDVREKKNSVGLYVVIGLLLVGMAGFGTSQFGTGSGSSNPAALSLGDSEISTQVFMDTLNSNRQRYTDLGNAEVQDLTLSQLRQDLALSEYIKKYPLATSNKVIDDMIRNNPSFHENGQFSEDVFRRYIRVEPQVYRNAVSQDLAKQTLQRTLATTSVVSQAEIAPYNEMQNLSRDILVAKIARADFNSTADDAEIQAFYDDNKNDFMTDEQVNVEYVELNPETVAENIEVSDTEIIAAAQPERSANYYLFTDEATANQAIENVKAGTALAEVVQTLGDKIDDNGTLDNLTAVAGEDSLIPQDATDAIFALARKGELTEPVSVDGSVYVFELANEPKVGLTEAEKSAAKTKLQQTKAAPQIAELSEKLNKAVFETQSPDLVSISEITGLPIKQSGLLSIDSNQDVLAVAELVEAINAGDKATGKLQDPVTVGERVIIYRLTEVKAPEQKALEAVKTEVEQAVITEKTDKQLAEATKALIEQTKSEGLQAAATAKNYPTQAYADFDGKIAEGGVLDPIGALFIMQQTPKLGNDNAQEITSMTGDVYVYVNTDVRLGKAEDADQATEKQAAATLASGIGQLELATFLQSIAANANIKMRNGLLQGDKAQ